MPRLHEPSLPKAGPGSAFASTAALSPKGTTKFGRGIRHPARNHIMDNTNDGDDIMEFDSDDHKIGSKINQAFPIISKAKKVKPFVNKVKVLASKSDNRKRSLAPGKNDVAARATKRLAEVKNVVLGRSTVKPISLPLRQAPSQSAQRPSFVEEQMAMSSSNPSANRRQLNRQALAVDTRMLTSAAGREEATIYLQQVKQFVHDVSNKGVAPSIIAASVEKRPAATPSKKRMSSRPSVSVQAFPYQHGTSQDLDSILSLVSIPSPINASNTEHVEAIHVPKRLLAHDSWKLFGELVDAVVQLDCKEEKPVNHVPIDITILTNDIALLCDVKQESHKQGVNRFWKMISAFSNSQVRNIDIVVAQTGRVALKDSVEKADPNGDDTDETHSMDSGDSEKTGEFALTGDELKRKKEASAESSAKNLHSANVLQSLAAIEHQLMLRASQDLKKLHQVSFLHHKPSSLPVNVGSSTLPNTRVGFLSLYRRWIRSALRDVIQEPGRIRFDLPETLDGTVCSVSLDVTYKLIPHRIHSQAALELANDLLALSAAKVELIQLVPIACLDASLLFGTPMTIRAGLELDMAQYQEMQLLVRCLLDNLTKKQLALVLRTSSREQGRGDGSVEDVVHHHSDQQLFVLTAEELGVGSSAFASAAETFEHRVPHCGVLYRYASAYQFLEESAGSEGLKMDNADATDMLKQYEEYVENAMECLDCDAINPLVIDVVRPVQKLPPASFATQIKNHDKFLEDVAREGTTTSVWDDTVGVGVRRAESFDSASIEAEDEAPVAVLVNDPDADVDDIKSASSGTNLSIDLAHSTDKSPLALLKQQYLDDDSDDENVPFEYS